MFRQVIVYSLINYILVISFDFLLFIYLLVLLIIIGNFAGLHCQIAIITRFVFLHHHQNIKIVPTFFILPSF